MSIPLYPGCKIQWEFDEFGWVPQETFVCYLDHISPVGEFWEYVTRPTAFVIAIMQGGP